MLRLSSNIFFSKKGKEEKNQQYASQQTKHNEAIFNILVANAIGLSRVYRIAHTHISIVRRLHVNEDGWHKKRKGDSVRETERERVAIIHSSY